jgi:hypothetical protein
MLGRQTWPGRQHKRVGTNSNEAPAHVLAHLAVHRFRAEAVLPYRPSDCRSGSISKCIGGEAPPLVSSEVGFASSISARRK